MTEFAAIDFESAGFQSGETNCPIQIGIACMKGDQLMPESFFRSYLQPPNMRNLSFAHAVHRIDPKALEGAPSLLSLWPTIRDRLRNRCILAHGSGTEQRHLRVFPFHGFGPWMDTLKLTRLFCPNLTDYSLGALIATFGLEEEIHAYCRGLQWHDALYDAVACLLLLRTLITQAQLWSQSVSVLKNPRPLHRIKP